MFRCYPDDEINTINCYEKFLKEANLDKYSELNKMIIGHGVQFPLFFMKDEYLKFRLKNKEYFVPNHNFT